MEKHLKALTGLSFAGLVGLFAVHGSSVLDVIAKVPAVLAAFTGTSVLGVYSFALSLAVACLVYWFLDKWLPTCKIYARRSLLIESFTLLVGILNMMLQESTGDQGKMMQALLVGIVVGLSAPLVVKTIRSFFKKNPA